MDGEEGKKGGGMGREVTEMEGGKGRREGRGGEGRGGEGRGGERERAVE